MKNLISKVTLLLLLSTFAVSSCKKDDSADKKTVKIEYRILVNADIDLKNGAQGSGIAALYKYTVEEIEKVSKVHNKAAWTITETAETEEAAIAACNKKAIAEFDTKLAAMDAACALVKKNFDAKKAELLPKISTEPTDTKFTFSQYGAYLFSGEKLDVTVKESKIQYEMKATGGEK